MPGPSEDHELVVIVTRAVPHGRARSTREIVDLLERAGLRHDAGTVEAALACAVSVVSVGPGLWRRR